MKLQSLTRFVILVVCLINSFGAGVAVGQSVLLNPTGSQIVSQPSGTSLNINTLNNVSSSSQYNWTRSPAGSLTGGVQATVTLSPCPIGIDVTPLAPAASWSSSNPYPRGSYVLDSNSNIEVAVVGGMSGSGSGPSWNTAQWNTTMDASVVWVNYGRVWFPYAVYVANSAGTTAEAVTVSGGSCTSGASSGTIIFTPSNSYGAGFSVSSSTAGIQEAINVVCGPTYGLALSFKNDSCKIVIPPNNQTATVRYNIYSTIYVHASHVDIYGYGANLDCYTRGPCIQLGDYLNSNDYTDITIEGLAFRNTQAFPALSNAFQGVTGHPNATHK